MTPWKPPPPVPRNRPFQVVSGSQISILIDESAVGVSVAVTRQNAGNGASVCAGLEPGTTKLPVRLSAADVIKVCSSCNDCRLVHGVAMADVVDTTTEAKRLMAAPTSGRSIVVLPDLYFGRSSVTASHNRQIKVR